MLTDNHGRTLDYLRLAVTDRCNLRCHYCMPAEGINFMPSADLLSFDEMLQLIDILSQHGIRKVRITGGEPFVRRGLIDFLEELSLLPTLETISLTTNATLISPYIDRLQRAGIRQVNVSLDALDADRFQTIARRDCYETVLSNLHQLIDAGFAVKVNCIVLEGQNTDQIIPLVRFTQDHPVGVRFLEEMPFNGSGSSGPAHLRWNHQQILRYIRQAFPDVVAVPSERTSTSVNYRIPDYQGSVGIIPAYSRTFCGSCNRLRISARGELRTCLYGKNEVSLRDALRQPDAEAAVMQRLQTAVGRRWANGQEAEHSHQQWTSMTSIGG